MTAVFYRDVKHAYPVAVKAASMYIFDDNDKAYLDMCGGAAVSCLGHQHPAIVEVLKTQADTMAFAHTAFFSNVPQERLAESLCARFGEKGAKAYFTAGGSEANETALKLVWQYWQACGQPSKIKIISRQHSYHGNTLGALSVSGNPARRAPVSELLHDWPRIEPCYAYRFKEKGESDAEYAHRAALQLETAILEAGPDTVAAFIAEPVSGASLGAVTSVPGYFAKIREICDRYDVLLIADEIMCGTGRTGTFYAHEQEGFLPDIVTLAKGLGGGYQPIAATVARAKIIEAFTGARGFSHGHTYVGHAMTCAVAGAVLDTIEKHQLLGDVQIQGKKFDGALKDAFGQHPNVGDIRGRGLFRAIELVSDKSSKMTLDDGAAVAGRIKDSAMRHGLMCYPSGGKLNAHILFAPPYILEDHHIDEAVERLKPVIKEVFDA